MEVVIMKYFMFAAVAASLVLAGCTPKLANRQLGPEEKEWKEYLEPMYPGWKMPGTLPPAISDRYEKNSNVSADDDGFGAPVDGKQSENADIAVADSGNNSLTGDVIEPENTKVRYEDYIVEKDDSLSRIAKKVYGNGRKYYRIQKANENLIKNPNRIFPGMKLRIPRP